MRCRDRTRRSCGCCCDPGSPMRVLDRLGDRARMLDPLLHNTVSATVLGCDDKFNVIPAAV